MAVRLHHIRRHVACDTSGSSWARSQPCGRQLHAPRGVRRRHAALQREAQAGVGGGICQLTNLLHWMLLHSRLTVVERSEHSFNPFPDTGRVLPWGVGCSIVQLLRHEGRVFRRNEIWRSRTDRRTGDTVDEEQVKRNRALATYSRPHCAASCPS